VPVYAVITTQTMIIMKFLLRRKHALVLNAFTQQDRTSDIPL